MSEPETPGEPWTRNAMEHMKAPNEDFYECVCGNNPHMDGLYPCDGTGHLVEPGPEWKGLYVCDSCGRIADANTYDPVACTVQVVSARSS